MQAPVQWIKYWRNSLADATRMRIDLDKVKTKRMLTTSFYPSGGKVPPMIAAELILIKQAAINESKQSEDTIQLHQVDVLIAPFALLPLTEHSKAKNQQAMVYPVWIPARLLENGNLLPGEDITPHMARDVLEPMVHDEQLLTLSTVDKVDEALGFGNPTFDSWADYWAFCNTFFQKVTDYSLDAYQAPDCVILREGVVILDENMQDAAAGIISLYDALERQTTLPPLFVRYATLAAPRLKPLLSEALNESWNSEHVGQMGYQHGLSPSQRKSLQHYLTLKVGDILAVNGPPGTGKTTLLQSIVANGVVQSAIQGQHPFVVVASSTNNQAVTNIIDSFAKAPTQPGPLAGRWLPDIGSYALYLPSAGKKEEDLKGTLYTKLSGGGFPDQVELVTYHRQAQAYFLKRCNQYAGRKFGKIGQAMDYLRQQLIALQGHLEQGQQRWQQYYSLSANLQTYGGAAAQLRLFPNRDVDTKQVGREMQQWNVLREQYLQSVHAEPWWMRTFSFIKWVRKKKESRYRLLFGSSPVDTDGLLFYQHTSLETFLTQKTAQLQQIKTIADAWQNWKRTHHLKRNPPELYEELDQTIRHQAFQLATHYWEGRWLEDVTSVIDSDDRKKRGKPTMEAKWRRYAMLTPCLVSTFYMLPKFFQYSAFSDGNFSSLPLLNYIDLLIVDEAGQVAPEVAGASFALAKKALIVGDIYQIEPVWNIPPRVDISNMKRAGLIADEKEKGVVQKIIDKGFAASSGSVMKIAQQASFYKLPNQKVRGMLLTEHRRCYDEIIQYCNELTYRGDLVPMRGKKPAGFLPAMGYAHVAGQSHRSGGSRMNATEAETIAQWLINNRSAIEQLYAGEKQRIEELVGIITPFTAQKHALIAALKKQGFQVGKMKIGTVHALQGAERAVVIFSPVYGGNEAGTGFFFDRGVHMLNVAVSRAKDSFLVFGDTTILFKPKAGTPSALLAAYLLAKKSNQIHL